MLLNNFPHRFFNTFGYATRRRRRRILRQSPERRDRSCSKSKNRFHKELRRIEKFVSRCVCKAMGECSKTFVRVAGVVCVCLPTKIWSNLSSGTKKKTSFFVGGFLFFRLYLLDEKNNGVTATGHQNSVPPKRFYRFHIILVLHEFPVLHFGTALCRVMVRQFR